MHFRGAEKSDLQGYKCTIEEGLRLAEKFGIRLVCDMPNTEPPVTNEAELLRRLAAAEKCGSKVKYMTWLGVTADPRQIAEAVRLWKKYREVVGLKMFAGRSTGSLAIIEREEQRIVYEMLAALGYEGPLAIHCEKEGLMRPGLYDPKRPASWAEARPKEAEVFSIIEQLEMARQAGFSGRLHICHVSCSRSVQIINRAKKEGVRISCGITPHMLLYSTKDMDHMVEENRLLDALFLKCNPPIRNQANKVDLLLHLARGEIDLIETDHAPHTAEDKLKTGASGAMSMPMLPMLVEKMSSQWHFDDQQIEKLLRDNAIRIFPKVGEMTRDV